MSLIFTVPFLGTFLAGWNWRDLSFEPAHESIVLFVLCKLIPQTCMHSHLVGLHVWFLVGPFVYLHTSCVRTAKALARRCGCVKFFYTVLVNSLQMQAEKMRKFISLVLPFPKGTPCWLYTAMLLHHSTSFIFKLAAVSPSCSYIRHFTVMEKWGSLHYWLLLLMFLACSFVPRMQLLEITFEELSFRICAWKGMGKLWFLASC